MENYEDFRKKDWKRNIPNGRDYKPSKDNIVRYSLPSGAMNIRDDEVRQELERQELEKKLNDIGQLLKARTGDKEFSEGVVKNLARDGSLDSVYGFLSGLNSGPGLDVRGKSDSFKRGFAIFTQIEY